MSIENPGKVWGCFHCGEVMGEYSQDNDTFTCESCGNSSVITFETALDTMIKLQRDGYVFQTNYYDEDEPAAEVDIEEADFETIEAQYE